VVEEAVIPMLVEVVEEVMVMETVVRVQIPVVLLWLILVVVAGEVVVMLEVETVAQELL
jgi:hypothetical protein